MKQLQLIQAELKAPKNLFNKFGGYAYRSCEGILEAVKPLLAKHGCTLTISDEMVQVGERYYLKATATIANDKGESQSVTGFAREEESKKGMDASQITGASSSYARKYALNGLLAIDDNKDSDDTNTHGKEEAKEIKEVKATTRRVAIPAPAAAPVVDEDTESAIMNCTTTQELSDLWKANPTWKTNKAIVAYVTKRKNELNKQMYGVNA